jgi:hypothetical protein
LGNFISPRKSIKEAWVSVSRSLSSLFNSWEVKSVSNLKLVRVLNLNLKYMLMRKELMLQ